MCYTILPAASASHTTVTGPWSGRAALWARGPRAPEPRLVEIFCFANVGKHSNIADRFRPAGHGVVEAPSEGLPSSVGLYAARGREPRHSPEHESAMAEDGSSSPRKKKGKTIKVPVKLMGGTTSRRRDCQIVLTSPLHYVLKRLSAGEGGAAE